MKKALLKNIALVLISSMLTATLVVGGTVAYLQDTDSDVNVMTVGNVYIEQHEYERVVNADGTYATGTYDNVTSYVLKDFTQGKPLYPATELDANGDPYNFGAGNWDNTVVRMTQVGSYGSMQVFTSKNAQDKFVTVENTGKTDAYVRTIVAIEVGSTDGTLVGSSYHNCWSKEQIGTIAIDGNNYIVFEYVYKGGQLSDGSWRHENGILPAGDTSYPSLAQVYLQAKATNEDMEAIDGNNNGTLDILVLSQAVQAAGFADAQTALDTAFGKSSEKAAEWFANLGNVEYVDADGAKASLEGEAAAEVLKDLESGKNLIVDKDMDIVAFDTNDVDAKGATVTLAGVGPAAYGYLAFIPDAGENVVVKNLNVTGSGFVEVGHYGLGGGDYTIENVKIENLESTLANGDKGFVLGCAFSHYGNATLNNCVMTGTTAISDGTIPVDAGFVNGTTTNVNGGKYGTVYCWSHAIVNIDDAEIDTIYVAPIKGSVTIKAGTKIDTIVIDYGNLTAYATDANLAKLVIEDGATVNSIVFDGDTYTLAEWLAR